MSGTWNTAQKLRYAHIYHSTHRPLILRFVLLCIVSADTWHGSLCIWLTHPFTPGFPHSSFGKESVCNAGDPSSIPGSGRPPGEGNGNPLHYSCLENPTDRGAWQATVHGVLSLGYWILNVSSTGVRPDFVSWYLLCPWYSPGKNTGVGSHSFSRGSSPPRDQTQVSCIAGRFFIIWATREALFNFYDIYLGFFSSSGWW